MNRLKQKKPGRFGAVRLALLCLLAILAIASTMTVRAAGAPGDLQFERDAEGASGGPFPPSIFPHWIHRIHYRCDACHTELFEMQKGATEVSMALMAEGKVCGACHDGVRAFDTSFSNCSRCHREPD